MKALSRETLQRLINRDGVSLGVVHEKTNVSVSALSAFLSGQRSRLQGPTIQKLSTLWPELREYVPPIYFASEPGEAPLVSVGAERRELRRAAI